MDKKWRLILGNFEEIISGIGISVTLIVTTANVLGRYIFGSTIPGYSDISILGFTWCTFIGISACYKRNMHYGVDILMLVLPKVGKSVLSLIIHTIVLITAYFATVLSYQLVVNTITGTGRVTSYLHIPYGFMYLPAVIGFGLILIHSIRFILKDIRSFSNGNGSDKKGNSQSRETV